MTASRKADKPKYGAELAVEVKRMMLDPPETHRILIREKKKSWSSSLLSEALDVDPRTVRYWLNGSVIPDDLDPLERVFFADQLDRHAATIQRLRIIAENCRYRRSEKMPLPEKRSDFATTSIYADTSGDLAALQYVDVDRLPVDEGWRFDAIRYGEGAQVIRVSGDSLHWLSPDTPLTGGVERRPLTDFFPIEPDAVCRQAEQTTIFLPRRIAIEGRKRRNAVIRIFVGTDAMYPQDIEEGDGERFTASAWLGRGGVAAFVDRTGSCLRRDDGEMGDGLGCVAVLVAVAYVERRPRYRTPYCLAIRKGMRYPDDVWLSPATGRPVFSGTDPGTSRFLFQSREAKGGATDMFAADFNGGHLFNLNEGDGSAWDGFVDEAGNDLVRWSGNRVTFASTITGKGFIEAIMREDRPG